MNPEDRALWDRYVRLRRGAPEGAGETGSIGGEDLAAIAAYLELRLDEWERAAFERRLIDEPILLDTLIAARAATLAAPTEAAAVPQAVTAFALNLAPAPATVRTRNPAPTHAAAPAPAAERRRWFLPAPGLVWSLVTATFLGAFAVGAIVTWQFTEPPISAETPKDKDPIKDEVRQRTNSIFEDPARTIFDGMDVDD
jgi:hypothetical protein